MHECRTIQLKKFTLILIVIFFGKLSIINNMGDGFSLLYFKSSISNHGEHKITGGKFKCYSKNIFPILSISIQLD